MTFIWCYSGVVLRAVVDTNVVFEGLTHLGPAAQVVDAWVANEFAACVSTALALEYQDVLGRKLGTVKSEQALMALQALLARAEYVPIHYYYRPASPDPGDDFVVECALNGRALLVTSNLRDFQEPARELGLVAIAPAEFVRLLTEVKP